MFPVIYRFVACLLSMHPGCVMVLCGESSGGSGTGGTAAIFTFSVAAANKPLKTM